MASFDECVLIRNMVNWFRYKCISILIVSNEWLRISQSKDEILKNNAKTQLAGDGVRQLRYEC